MWSVVEATAYAGCQLELLCGGILGYCAEKAALWREVVVEVEWRGAGRGQAQADE